MNWDMMAGRWPTDGLRARVFNFNLYCGCDGGVTEGSAGGKGRGAGQGQASG